MVDGRRYGKYINGVFVIVQNGIIIPARNYETIVELFYRKRLYSSAKD